MSTALAPWSLRLLGALTLTRGERSVSRFRQQRTGLLLALLARVPGRALARDAVVEQLWPEVDPAVGGPRLRVLLAEIQTGARNLLDSSGQISAASAHISESSEVQSHSAKH